MLPAVAFLATAATGVPLHTLAAQEDPPLSLSVAPLDGPIHLDGILDEAVWAAADSLPGLTMTEPVEGGTPVGRTVVRVLADRRELIIGIVAYDPDPAGIVSFSKARDPELRAEDHVILVLDTYLDGRSGYTFAVNPTGARYDALVSGVGERQSADWDGIWEAHTAVGSWGWSVEIRIPIATLGFRKGLREWGFNIQRQVQRLQEVSRWASPKRDYAVTQTSRAGRLTRLPAFELGVGISVRPALVGRSSSMARTSSRSASARDGTSSRTTPAGWAWCGARPCPSGSAARSRAGPGTPTWAFSPSTPTPWRA